MEQRHFDDTRDLINTKISHLASMLKTFTHEKMEAIRRTGSLLDIGDDCCFGRLSRQVEACNTALHEAAGWLETLDAFISLTQDPERDDSMDIDKMITAEKREHVNNILADVSKTLGIVESRIRVVSADFGNRSDLAETCEAKGPSYPSDSRGW